MAAMMLSILMVGLAMHLRGGLVAWRKTVTTLEEAQRLRVALERLGQDLANAVIVDPRPESVPKSVFGPAGLQFYTVQPVPGSSGAEGRVWVVTYRLESEEEVPTLVRTRQLVRAAKAGLPVPEEQLLASVKRLGVRYGYLPAQGPSRIAWQGLWDDAEQLPRLVELTIELEPPSPLPGEIRRVIVIPQGILKPVPEAS